MFSPRLCPAGRTIMETCQYQFTGKVDGKAHCKLTKKVRKIQCPCRQQEEK
jgi:hypothetical protein